VEKIFEPKCAKCGIIMKKIPIKKLDSTFIIEYYCERCEESVMIYPNLDESKENYPRIF